jgi:hypothetical protein
MEEPNVIAQPLTLEERWASLAVKLACPKCNATGLIPVRELARALVCNACSSWYRVEPTQLVEIPPPHEVVHVEVRGSMSEYRPHQVTLPDRRRRSIRAIVSDLLSRIDTKGLPWRWLAVAVAVPSLIALVVLVNSRAPHSTVSENPLPYSLTDRAKLLVDSWLKDDVRQMLRLVEPARDRQFRQWLAAHPAPEAAAKPLSDRTTTIDVASQQPLKPSAMDLVMRVEFLGDAAGAPLTFKHRWVSDKNGTWYFLPSVPPQRARTVRK